MSIEMEDKIQFQEDILNHVVLPRVLPQEKAQNPEQLELALLSSINDAVKQCKEWLPSSTVHLFESFERVHINRTPETISEEIKVLKAGRTFAFFVRRQNYAFLIHMPRDGNYRKPNQMKTVYVATFPGSFHPKEIYDHPSDLQVTVSCDILCVFRIVFFSIRFDFSSSVRLSSSSLKSEIFKDDAVHGVCTTTLSFL